MKLFHVQDDDRSMYVIADTWRSAFNAWRKQMAAENDIDQGEVSDPLGIQFIAGHDEGAAFPNILIVQNN